MSDIVSKPIIGTQIPASSRRKRWNGIKGRDGKKEMGVDPMDKLDTILQWIGLMALFFGVLGLAIGYFGPIVLMPEANQGPLIGIFITGPGGAIAGAFIGAVIGYKKSKSTKGK